MTKPNFRVGINGADTAASWAGASHVPALAAQPNLELVAVATRREESARAAAEAFGAERWYADPYALIADETIDIVTVAVKVPAHRDLVLAALKAGKAVYSESPLGVSVAETEEMAAAVGDLHTAIGLQGRHNPAVRRAAELIEAGAIGRLMSARVLATTFGYGPQSPSVYDYFNKAGFGGELPDNHHGSCGGCNRGGAGQGDRGRRSHRASVARYRDRRHRRDVAPAKSRIIST